MRGGPASHIDQGRRSRFPARVLLRPALIMLHARTSHDSCACLHTYVLACVKSLQRRKGENLSRFLMRLNVVCSLKKGR